MAADMKENIAEAAKRLLLEKNVKKLTVKDIVEECQITRQAFYYHFEDISEMLRWVLERDAAQLFEEICAQEDGEKALRYFFLTAVNAEPYVRKGMQTNYGDEIERLLEKHIHYFLGQAVEARGLYQDCSRFELEWILRYHSQAVIGILRNWTEEDTENLDRIVHQVYLLMMGKISPFPNLEK